MPLRDFRKEYGDAVSNPINALCYDLWNAAENRETVDAETLTRLVTRKLATFEPGSMPPLNIHGALNLKERVALWLQVARGEVDITPKSLP